MGIGKFAGIGLAAVLNVVMFLLHPYLGAVGLPFAIGVAITLLKDMTKVAGGLYLFMFGFLIAGINLIAGVVALFFGGAAAIRLILIR
jgi:hypothetical protein